MPDGGVRGLVWRCTKYRCCNQSRVSVREDSVFAFRKMEIMTQFMVLYCWLAKCSNQTIGLMTGADPATIRELIIDFQYLMEQDVNDEDVTIGMCIYIILESATLMIVIFTSFYNYL